MNGPFLMTFPQDLYSHTCNSFMFRMNPCYLSLNIDLQGISSNPLPSVVTEQYKSSIGRSAAHPLFAKAICIMDLF